MANLIYTVAGTQTTVENQPLNLGNIIRRYGASINSEGTTDFVSRSGYYNVEVTAVVTNTTGAGVDLTLDATQNGVNIVGGTARASLANNATQTLTFGAVIRTYCSGMNAVQIVPNVSGITIETLGVRIEGV